MAKVPGYTRLRKPALWKAVARRIGAALILQRFFRRSVQDLANCEDFAVGERFRPGQAVFRIVEPGLGRGKVYRVLVTSMIYYLGSSPNFDNPYTRRPLTAVELKRLTRQARLQLQVAIVDLWDHKPRVVRILRERHERQMTLDWLVEETRDVAEHLVIPTEPDPVLSLHTLVLPNLTNLMQQIQHLSPSTASATWRSLLRRIAEEPVDLAEPRAADHRVYLSLAYSLVVQASRDMS